MHNFQRPYLGLKNKILKVAQILNKNKIYIHIKMSNVNNNKLINLEAKEMPTDVCLYIYKHYLFFHF